MGGETDKKREALQFNLLRKNAQFYFTDIEGAEILNYKNPHDAVKRHCVNEFPCVVFHDVGINTSLAVQTIQKKYINKGIMKAIKFTAYKKSKRQDFLLFPAF